MSGNLLRNLLLFGRVLRGLGLDVNPGRMIDLVMALQFISIGSRSDFYHAARGLLVHRHEDIASFDEAFEFFWRSRGRELTSLDLRVDSGNFTLFHTFTALHVTGGQIALPGSGI